MQLAYKTYGEGYPLIILHGLFGSLENWQTLSRVFAKCYRVFAVDQRNHGHSPHDPIMNYAVMAEDLREFMQAHQLSSAYLLGHSMGGKTNITTCVRPNGFLRSDFSEFSSLSQNINDIAKGAVPHRLPGQPLPDGSTSSCSVRMCSASHSSTPPCSQKSSDFASEGRSSPHSQESRYPAVYSFPAEQCIR